MGNQSERATETEANDGEQEELRSLEEGQSCCTQKTKDNNNVSDFNYIIVDPIYC